MATPAPRPLRVLFFQTDAGNEPVREWLLTLSRDEKKTIGADILAVQWIWPVGKPLVDSLGGGLWEVRSSLGARIARVFFIVIREDIILLHGIIKKSRTTPKQELDLARKRQSLCILSTDPIHENKNVSKRPPRK
ncbi:MAG: type II toxin-antitoxin system RelE/ParE family toxin [Verrucomicrobia bacterium]|nr:type II toxin-antitoxin system RelE/ParE family toxin [Verrucomicrobiota bacterium]